MTNIAIFASGSGSNFQEIVRASKSGELDVNVVLLISDQKDAYVLERAKKEGIPSFVFNAKEFPNKAAFEALLVEKLKEKAVEWVVLAGYMRLIGETLLEAFPKKIINLHPALLPAFPGLHAIDQAFDYGVKVAGVTIHYVDEGMDTGQIIAQETVLVEENDTVESLEEKIHKIEHDLYPRTLKKLIK